MEHPVDIDVRMRGFSRRMDAQEALEAILSRCGLLEPEPVSLWEAAGRVLAEEIRAPCHVPGFPRAAMDGYAVRAEETLGASTYQPVPLRLVGEAWPGRPFSGRLGPGEAVRIMTGAMVPDGADAVVMAEYAREEGELVWITEPVPQRRHISEVGEDIRAGEVLFPAGRKLRPQDLGVLSSVGYAQVPVVRRPRVDLVITGDELLPVGSRPEGSRIVDANSVMLYAFVSRDGATPRMTGLVPDRVELLEERLLAQEADVVLVTGGTSVGQEDLAPLVVARRGQLLVHGVAVRPSSPTGFGLIGNTLVFLLPGNPVSCLAAYDLFAGPAIRKLGGLSPELPYPQVQLRLVRKISSVLGRLDYVRVKVRQGEVEPLAVSGASILSSTTRADGFVLVPPDSEGYAPGEEVTVYLYDLPPK
jgi:molybdopterin molybdotransferase